MACCFPFMAAIHESGYASIVSVSDWNTLGRIVVPPRISHFADNGQRLYGTNAGCVYELQMLKDVAPSIAACDSRCIRTLPPDVAWAVASGIDMLLTSPLFASFVHEDSQFVATLQEVQRCVERLQSLAAFVCSVQVAQGVACADRSAMDTEIERAVHLAAHDHLTQQLRIRHARDDILIAEAASFFLSMDPEEMGVAAQHAAAVRDAVTFSMHRKHRSLNRRRGSIDALTMLSRDDNVSPTLENADVEGPVTADTDQATLHVDQDGPRSVDTEPDGSCCVEDVGPSTVKPSLDAVFEAAECIGFAPIQPNDSQQSDDFELLQPRDDQEPHGIDGLDDTAPSNACVSAEPIPSLFLPMDILSIGSLRSSPNEESGISSDAISNEAVSATISEQGFKMKRRGASGTPLAAGEGRRGSVEFDAESFLSLGSGSRVSFIDLSESAQVCC
jgi:hypothetical protein